MSDFDGGEVRAVTGADCTAWWRLDALSDDVRRAVLAVTSERGRSMPVYVRCHGHDTGKHGRVWLEGALLNVGGILGLPAESVPIVRLVADRQGPLSGVEVIRGEGENYEDTERWRLECPECGRSGDRNTSALRDECARVLLGPSAARARGEHRKVRVSWWAPSR